MRKLLHISHLLNLFIAVMMMSAAMVQHHHHEHGAGICLCFHDEEECDYHLGCQGEKSQDEAKCGMHLDNGVVSQRLLVNNILSIDWVFDVETDIQLASPSVYYTLKFEYKEYRHKSPWIASISQRGPPQV